MEIVSYQVKREIRKWIMDEHHTRYDIDGYEINESVHCRTEQETRRTSIETVKEGLPIGVRTVYGTLPPKD